MAPLSGCRSLVGMPNRDLRVIVLQLFGSMPSLLNRASMAAATFSGATMMCRCWPAKVVTGHPRASAAFPAGGSVTSDG